MTKMNVKKTVLVILSVVCIAFSSATTMAADLSWQENKADISIYKTAFSDLYDISFLNETTNQEESTFEGDVKNGIRIVMVNGGFVPDAKTLLKDGIVYIPLSKFAEIFDFDVKYDSYSFEMTIQNSNTNIVIPNIENIKAYINGKECFMPSKVEKVGNEFYVPLRFTAEAFGGAVEYIENYMSFMDKDTYIDLPDIHVISVEFCDQVETTYTINDGLEEIILLSLEKYNQIENKSDYDPENIFYIGKNIGRYYIYKLKDFETLPIFFNKYTGEIYSEKSGLPFLLIDKGFPNINYIL